MTFFVLLILSVIVAFGWVLFLDWFHGGGDDF